MTDAWYNRHHQHWTAEIGNYIQIEKGTAESDGSTTTDKSNVTHQGKSDCRRDLWANKLHKHKQTVSTRQTDITARAWSTDIHPSLTIMRHDAVKYCIRCWTGKVVSSCKGLHTACSQAVKMQQVYRQDYKAEMQAACGRHHECRMKCLNDGKDLKV